MVRRIKLGLVALMLAIGVTFGATVTTHSSASAAQYCPNPFYCSNGFQGYFKYILCGPYIYNPFIGLFIDRCGYVLL